MKRLSISSALIFLALLPVWGQKEISFFNKSGDSIKVESMRGIEIHTEMADMFSMPYSVIPVYIGYFNEKRTASTWTVISSIGLYNAFYKTYDYSAVYTDPITGNFSFGGALPTKNAYALSLSAGIEPRCYWTYKNRYPLGLSQLNSGWFLSFPFTLKTTLLNSPEPYLQQGWLPSYFSVGFAAGLKLGYRQAITKQLFVEASAGLNLGTSVYILNSELHVSHPNVYPQVLVKAAYTFK